MARTELPEETPDLTPDEIAELEPDANENAVEMLFQQAASENDWKYRVLRRTGETSRDLEFVMEAMPSDFPSQSSLELYLSQNYGGGKYRVLVYFRGKLKKNLELRIAESKLKNPLAQAGFDPAGAKIAQVLERMISASDAQHAREMAALRDDLKLLRTQPTVDPLLQMEKLAGLLRTLVPATVSAPVADNGLRNMLQFMEMQERLENRWRERNRDPDNPPSWLDVLNNAPKIIEAVKGLRNDPLPLPSPAASTSDPPTAALTAPTPVPQGEPMNDDFSRLLPLFQVLQTQAEADNDPATYAALILDNADRVAGPGTLDRLLAFPDLQARIEKVYPQAATRKTWWQELIALLRSEGTEPDATGDAGQHTAE